MTTNCSGIMGRIFGHKFVPVITRSPSKFVVEEGLSTTVRGVIGMAELYRAETFHGCICQRCGAVTGESE